MRRCPPHPSRQVRTKAFVRQSQAPTHGQTGQIKIMDFNDSEDENVENNRDGDRDGDVDEVQQVEDVYRADSEIEMTRGTPIIDEVEFYIKTIATNPEIVKSCMSLCACIAWDTVSTTAKQSNKTTLRHLVEKEFQKVVLNFPIRAFATNNLMCHFPTVYGLPSSLPSSMSGKWRRNAQQNSEQTMDWRQWPSLCSALSFSEST
jgi:hypothetical protein